MRISDWSSDVCASDLQARLADRPLGLAELHGDRLLRLVHGEQGAVGDEAEGDDDDADDEVDAHAHGVRLLSCRCCRRRRSAGWRPACGGVRSAAGTAAHRPIPPDHRGSPYRCRSRSEEHTSELQSLMRISYAVFCLKKKIERTKQARYT